MARKHVVWTTRIPLWEDNMRDEKWDYMRGTRDLTVFCSQDAFKRKIVNGDFSEVTLRNNEWNGTSKFI